MAYDPGSYNACLSITILPTELGQILHVDSPYVYKLFFQLIFALTPILAYGIARRYFNRGISTLAVAYFVGFPTFFTDMPFLNRQEIAFLFVGAGVLAATNTVWSWRRRQVSLIVAGIGMEVSHYSTMYMFVGTLGIALLCSYALRIFIRSESKPERPHLRRGQRLRAYGLRNAVTFSLMFAFIAIVFGWGTLATKTTGQVLTTGGGALSSHTISLNLFGKTAISPEMAITELRDDTLKSRGSQAALYLPTSAVAAASTPVVDQPTTPLTTIGRAADSVGVPVVALNSLVRNFVAYGEQLFLGIGLVSLIVSRRRGQHLVGRQFFCLCIGSIGMVAANTVLPVVAADYGPLRAFQQGLLFFGPIIVIGSMTVFGPIGRYGARIATSALCLGFFLATSTIVPQLMGGNLAELNLNNAGLYYDLYYVSPQESSAKSWLGAQPNVFAYQIQASFLQEKFYFTDPFSANGYQAVTDAYPTLVLRDSWVILAPPTVGTNNAYTLTPANGALTEYKYPTGLLREYKDVVYTNGKAVVYK
jgi:uncharacterized membrane protein